MDSFWQKQTMITRINHFQSAEGKADELHAFLKSLAPYISASKGCLSFKILRSTTSNASFVVIEDWTDAASHQMSLVNFPKEKMQASMPLFGAPPSGDYYTE